MDIKKLENALILIEKKDFKKAKKSLEELIKKSDDPFFRKKCDALLSICNNSLTPVDEKDADPFTQAVFYLNNEQYENAAEILLSLLKKNTSNDDILFTLAICYAKQENNEKAMEYLKQSVEINSNNKFLALNSEDFGNIHEQIEEI